MGKVSKMFSLAESIHDWFILQRVREIRQPIPQFPRRVDGLARTYSRLLIGTLTPTGTIASGCRDDYRDY